MSQRHHWINRSARSWIAGGIVTPIACAFRPKSRERFSLDPAELRETCLEAFDPGLAGEIPDREASDDRGAWRVLAARRHRRGERADRARAQRPAIAHGRTPLTDQVGQLHAQRPGDAVERIEVRRVQRALEAGEGHAVEAGLLRQRFLRQAARLPQFHDPCGNAVRSGSHDRAVYNRAGETSRARLARAPLPRRACRNSTTRAATRCVAEAMIAQYTI